MTNLIIMKKDNRLVIKARKGWNRVAKKYNVPEYKFNRGIKKCKVRPTLS